MNRRHFLKIAGIATGVTASLPLQSYAGFLFDGHPPLKVGVVLPHSTLSSDIGKKLIDGLTLQFTEAGWTDTRLLVRQTVKGAEITGAATLLKEEGIEILTGMFNPLTLHRLRGHLEQSGAFLINMEGGANVFNPREESPFIFHNSLGYWQSNWAMGNWAAANMGKRAAFISSFYETGYDSHYAFPQGFQEAGGQIIYRDITHLSMGQTDLNMTMTAIGNARPDFVFITASDQEAVDFVSAYHAAGLAGSIPLAASGFLVHDTMLKTMGKAACGITSCASWTPTLKTTANKKFCADFFRATGEQPDSFAVLGYDTGAMIVQAVQAAAGRVRQARDLKNALDNLNISSPRGAVTMTAATGNTAVPLYICHTSRNGNTVCNSVLQQAPGSHVVERHAQSAALIAQSGWTDAYLCA